MTEREEQAITVLNTLYNNPLLSDIHRQALEVGIMAIKALEQEQKWIPVSERLPEEDDYKSCIECMDGAVWYFTENGKMGIGYYYKSTKEWSTIDDLKIDEKVVMWIPFPTPYQSEIQTGAEGSEE